jgi:hypothetical protein
MKAIILMMVSAMLLVACAKPTTEVSSEKDQMYRKMADALYAVMKGTRTAYTKHVIARLGGKGKKVVEPNEHWQDLDNGVMLPAQMFRTSRDLAMEEEAGFYYSLQSIWPINSKNAAETPLEIKGLEYIAANPGERFYGYEVLGQTNYFTAIYPDIAVSQACVDCHNEHVDSPRKDFKLMEIMGGIVMRIPVE